VWQIVVDLRTKFLCVLIFFAFSRGCGESHSLISSPSIGRFSTMPTRSAPIGDSTPVLPAGTPAPPVSGTGRPRGADARPPIWRLPDARDDHLLRLTDSTGIQHATFTIPNYRHGYARTTTRMIVLGIGRRHIVSSYADDSKEPAGSDGKTGRLVLSKPLD
jgi:hypothetical protein